MKNRVALITGGSSGIGAATAAVLLSEGYDVAICARNVARLHKTATRLAAGDRLFYRATDIGVREAVCQLVADVVEKFGRLDALVNAGAVPGTSRTIEELTDADWMEVLNVNLMGTVHTIAAAIPHLKQTRGSIVNISSIGAFAAQATAAPYGVSKAGIVALTMSAAAELARDGIRVNAIAPGWVDTPMARPDFEQAGVVGKDIDSSMLGRPADPREIATVVSFLLSEAASFITAETIVADGGHITLIPELRERVRKQ